MNRKDLTHPYYCDNPKGSHQIFISPNPVAVAIPLWRMPDGRPGVALGLRGIEPRKGFWALAGGFMEGGETGPQAASGELSEEQGVHIPPEEFTHEAEHALGPARLIIHFYVAIWKHAYPPPLFCTSETEEVSIFPVDELPENPAFDYQWPIIQAAAKRLLPTPSHAFEMT